MPQPHLPAPTPRRPEPGADLLEAISQRRIETCLRLTEQWVHRRGITDLRRFCDAAIEPDLGPEAVLWLQKLLASDRTLSIPPSEESPVVQAEREAASTFTTPQDSAELSTPRPEPSGPDPVPVAGAAPSQEDGEPAGSPSPGPDAPWGESTPTHERADPAAAPPGLGHRGRIEELESSLHNRAEAAVDAAFAALEQSFAAQPGIADSDLSSARAEGDPEIKPPTPRAPQAPPAPTPQPPAPGMWPSLTRSALSVSAALQAQPAGPHGPAGASGENTTVSQGRGGPSRPLTENGPEVAATDGQEIPEPQAASDPRTLFDRLRGRLNGRPLPRFTRLRAVLSECVEEAIGLLQRPEDVGAGSGHAAADRLQEPPLPPTPTADPRAPITAAAWPPSLTSPSPTSPPPPAQPRRTASGLRLGLQGHRRPVADRPAPAPSSLSDLQVWLPGRDDLPRAS